MKIIRTAKHSFNLRHMITHQEGPVDDVPDGVVRVTVLPGKPIDLIDDEARDFLGQLDEIVPAPGPLRVIHPIPVPAVPAVATPDRPSKSVPRSE